MFDQPASIYWVPTECTYFAKSPRSLYLHEEKKKKNKGYLGTLELNLGSIIY